MELFFIILVTGILTVAIYLFVRNYRSIPLWDFGQQVCYKLRPKKIIEVIHKHFYVPIVGSKRRRFSKASKRLWQKFCEWFSGRIVITIFQFILGVLIFWDMAVAKGYFNLYWGLPLGIIILQGIKKDFKKNRAQTFFKSLKRQFNGIVFGSIKIFWAGAWLIIIIYNII